MTNEEKKSNEIAAEYLAGHDRFDITYEEMREAVMTMAEWKDAQFKEYLEKKKAEIEQGIYHSNPLIDGDRWCGRADVINEIINELFGGE